jgi:hypothetical protein
MTSNSHHGLESHPLRACRLSLLSLLGAAALCLTSACGGLSGGLSEHQAVAKATKLAQQMSSTPVTFVAAASGHLGDFGIDHPNPDTAVWAVTFDGTFPAVSCGPAVLPGQSPHACAGYTSTRLFLNYASGALILSASTSGG